MAEKVPFHGGNIFSNDEKCVILHPLSRARKRMQEKHCNTVLVYQIGKF